jgi:TPR repeat protein
MPVRPWYPDAVGEGSGGSLVDLAYGLGEQYERDGDLEQAAQWFRRAAESDRRRAALRLGDVLGRLADERPPASERLLAEATRWMSDAPDATTPDAIELITDMLNRHQRAAARRGLETVPAG